MNYFMSDIHGNAKAYFAMKAKINFGKDDQLYILGNIFDRNTDYPEHCLAILDDIMENQNITLLLGDHEYAHVMYHASRNSVDKTFKEAKVHELRPSGKALLDYMKKLPEERLDEYISYLVGCQLSAAVCIGERNFYLVHGAPKLLSECTNICNWEEQLASQEIDLSRTYKKEIARDENCSTVDWKNVDDTIIICGNLTTEKAVDTVYEIRKDYFYGEHSEYQKVIFYENKMLINCGCQWDEYFSELIPTLACLSIDEEGYSVTYKYNI